MMDDFLIYGKSRQEHYAHLEQVLKRAYDLGIKFNKDKSGICLKEVKYLSFIFHESGISVDPSKVESICKMPIPNNITDL